MQGAKLQSYLLGSCELELSRALALPSYLLRHHKQSSQSLNGKPSRPRRHLRSSTWHEAETSSETLFFRYEALTRQHEELSTPLCHSGDDKQRPHSHSAAPGITGSPPFLRLWNALRLRTFCCLRTEWFPHIITCAGSRSTFTETTASGNLLDI